MQVGISNKNRKMSEGWDTEELQCPISEDKCCEYGFFFTLLHLNTFVLPMHFLYVSPPQKKILYI